MKKHLLALAALATVSSVAVAQNVTMYGFMDIGVLKTNNGSSTGQNLTTMNQGGGNFFPSMYGFTGSEDLGAGLKASFNLQGSLNVAQGQGGNTAAIGNGNLFDRYSSVTLAGSAGSVELGRQIDILFLQSFLNGVMPTHANSLAVNGLLAFSKSASTTSEVAGSRVNNAITYTTPAFNGLKAKVMYGKGEVAGNSSASDLLSYLATYDVGSLNLSAGYETQKNSSDANSFHKSLVGAKYTLGSLTFAAQYHNYKENAYVANTSVDASAVEVGVAYKVSPNLTVALNHENYDNNNTATYKSPKVTSIKAKYDLSKRTYLYGMAADYNKDASKTFYQGYAAVAPTAAAAKSSTNFAVGVVHGF